jgi:hypothetical protein
VKKIIAVLTFVAVVGVLSIGATGCDNKTKSPPTPPKTPTATETPKTPTADKTPTKTAP